MQTCKVCETIGFERFMIGRYTVWECPRCTQQWCWPLPTDQELRAFYDQGHHAHAKSDEDNAVHRVRIIRRIRSLAPRARSLLDVGCGYGHFLDPARRSGFECFGVDLDPERAAVARRKGHRAYAGFFPDACPPDLRFDAVILSHVIEHVPDPLTLLRNIRSRMAPGGIFYLETPNFGCLRARVMGARFNHYSPPEHIMYFTVKSLTTAMTKAGFAPFRMETESHTQHAKDLLAYAIRLRFLQKPQGLRLDMPPRFTEGRFRWAKRLAYGWILCGSACVRPMLDWSGGDHILSFWTVSGSRS